MHILAPSDKRLSMHVLEHQFVNSTLVVLGNNAQIRNPSYNLLKINLIYALPEIKLLW